jgi:hypothetical protein
VIDRYQLGLRQPADPADTKTTLNFRCTGVNLCVALDAATAAKFLWFNQLVNGALRAIGQPPIVVEDEMLAPATLALVSKLAAALPDPAVDKSGFFADLLVAKDPGGFILGNIDATMASLQDLGQGKLAPALPKPGVTIAPAPPRQIGGAGIVIVAASAIVVAFGLALAVALATTRERRPVHV